MKPIPPFFVLVVSLVLVTSSSAAIINVPGDQPTIQDGINAAVSGVDEVVVAPGVYFETINFLGKAITVRSSGGAGVTRIDASGAGPVVTCFSGEGPATVLEGFTIRNGSAGQGGGMRNENSSPTVLNCLFRQNQSTAGFDGGGAMFNQNSNPAVINCVFVQNSAQANGGGIFNNSSSPTIINCTLTLNTAQGGGGSGLHNQFASFPTVTNCIVWNNFGGAQIQDAGGASTVTFSDVQGGGFPGAGNFSADPKFVAPPFDLRLDRFSPCVDAADNDAVSAAVVTDLDGSGRFADDAGVADAGNAGALGPPVVDMGAYERQLDSGPITFNVNPGESIQAAIDAAIAGDVIEVAQGTYDEIIDFSGKAITLRSTNPTNPAVVAATIIDATDVADPGDGKPVVRCDSGEGPGTVLDGFTITGGTGDTSLFGQGVARGGGMFNSGEFDNGVSPTVSNCTFSGNTADLGGGMYNLNSSPTVTNCTLNGNTATEDGGGMYNRNFASPTVTNCTFSGNSADHGGGMYTTTSSPTVTSCTFSGNTANFDGGGMYTLTSSQTVTSCTFSGNTAISEGGGMYNSASSPTVTSCAFSGNTARVGGGMHNNGGSPTVTNCTFSENSSVGFGGAGGGCSNFAGSPTFTNCVFSANSAPSGGGMDNSGGDTTVINCTFSGNTASSFRGGGIDNNGGGLTVVNCTFSGNTAITVGGGITINGSPTVTNCIFWHNADAGGMDDSGQIHVDDGTPVVSYSNVQGGWTGEGTGNINADPLFVDADGADDVVGTDDDDLRLSGGSPCIDGADSVAYGFGPPVDLDGNDRAFDDPLTPDTGVGLLTFLDMGAYEFPGEQADCLADLDGNGEVRVPDLIILLGAWGACP